MTNDPNFPAIRMLLIEDNVDYFQLFKRRLQAVEGALFEIENSPTLAEAVKTLGEKHFDLILLDLNLPDSEGVATFDRLASLEKDVPFVILSGLNDEKMALDVVKKGAQDYIVKGELDGKTIARILRYAVERYRHIKEVEALNRSLEELSFLDPLTRLLNRRGLKRVLSRELHASNREGSDLAVMMLDLDNFKPINDTFGHATGDIVLQEVAKILKSTVRATDYISRVGGDEFIILLPNTRSAEALHFSERVRLAISRTPTVSSMGETIRTTASFGVVYINKPVLSIDELLEQTHNALARSKRLGKNRVNFGNGQDHNHEDVVEKLKTGKCFHSVKQPILDLAAKKTIGYEFLTRSNIHGYEMPDEFLMLSLEKEILSIVDHRCLEVSMTASYGIPPAYEKHVNLFPSTIAGLQKEEFKRLFPPEMLTGNYCVEISEQQILGDSSYLLHAVGELRKRGVRIAVDDLGFGRSCLESLIVLQPETIKIDKKIIKDISWDKGRKEMLRRLLHVVSAFHAKVIAEGIESVEDLAVLEELGVRYGQGFLFGKPEK